MNKRKSFTKEFKLEAVRLLKEVVKPASDIALELGIRRNQLYKWQEMLHKTGNVTIYEYDAQNRVVEKRMQSNYE